MNPNDVKILVNPEISEEQLWDFYVCNDICEAGYGDKKITAVPLINSSLVVGSFCKDKLVGIIRVIHDGLTANICECSLELELQGYNRHENGSLLENDKFGIAKQMWSLMKKELDNIGVNFISYVIAEDVEKSVAESFGLTENIGHREYILDNRQYVKNDEKNE